MVKTNIMALVHRLLVLSFLVCAVSLNAQEPHRDSLLSWMDQIAQQQLRQRMQVIDQIHTLADADRRKQCVRKKLLELLGGLPYYKGPLNARVTGQLQNNSYTIEK